MGKRDPVFFGEHPIEPGVPRWAKFLKPAEFLRFLVVVEAELTRRGVAVFGLAGATVSLEGPDNTIERHSLIQLGLDCVACHPDAWPRIVRQHFKRLFVRHSMAVRLAHYEEHWEDAIDEVLVRVIPENALGLGGSDGLTTREIAPGVWVQLVYQINREIIPVPLAHVQSWHAEFGGVRRDEVEDFLGDALEAVRLPRNGDIESMDVEGGGEVFVLSGDPAEVGIQALRTEDLLDFEAPWGMLVAIPDLSHVVFARVEPANFRELIRTIQPVARHHVATAVSPLSATVYYVKDGVFQPLDALLRELLDVLNSVTSLAWAAGGN